MRTLTVTWTHIWADNLRDRRTATLTYTPSTHLCNNGPGAAPLTFTDSEALHEMLCQINTGGTYTVKFAPATKKAVASARVPLSFNLDRA